MASGFWLKVRAAMPLLASGFVASTIGWAQGGSSPRIQVSPDQVQLSAASGLTKTVSVSRLGQPGGPAINFTVTTKSNRGWLSADPTSGTVPATLTIRATPGSLAPGEYEGTVTVKPSLAGVSSEDVSVTLRVGNGGGNGGGGGDGPPSTVMVRPGALNFNAVAGGSNPDSLTLNISSPGGGSAFNWTATKSVSTPSGGNWLQISPASGTGAGTVTVSANITGLTQGRYTGTVRITSGSSNSDVQVGLEIRPASEARLVIDPRAFNFIVTPGSTATPASREMRVKNAGSGVLNWTAKATTAAGGPAGWLSISPASGTTPASIGISVNTTGLAVGMYEGSVDVKSGSTTESARVFLRILGPASGSGGDQDSPGGNDNNTSAVQFSPRVVEFRAPSAGAATTPASATVQLTSKTSGLTFSASATTAKGGNWLTLTPSAGTIPGSLTVTAATTGLSNGTYSGVINVKVQGSVNEQRVVPVVLKIGDDDTEAGDDGVAPLRLTLLPGAVVLQATPGGPAPAPVPVSLNAVGTGASSGVGFQASVSTLSGGNWLTASPLSGTTPSTIKISAVNPGNLAPGAYRGTVVFQPLGSSSSTTPMRPVTLQVLLIVRAPDADDDVSATSPSASMRRRDGGKGPTLNFGDGTPSYVANGVFVNPSLDFLTTVSKPEAVQVMVFGQNGKPLEGARVRISGVDSDSIITLDDAGGGLYTGFFEASSAGALALTARVQSTTDNSELLKLSVGGDAGFASGDPSPVILRGGIVSADSNAPNPAPIAPGSAISIFGRSLAGDDVRVLVGGVEAAVLQVRSGAADGVDQIDVQTPGDLADQSYADVVVLRKGVFSAPEGIVLGVVTASNTATDTPANRKQPQDHNK